MRVMDSLEARGHRSIIGVHSTTFEVTKDAYLTRRGDCIIGVKSSKAVSGLSEDVKKAAATDGASIKILMEVDGIRDEVLGTGDSRLKFTDNRSVVIRRSSFTCGRTLMIRSNKAASDLSRTFINALKTPKSRLLVDVIVEV